MSIWTVILSPIAEGTTASAINEFISSVELCPQLTTCSGEVHKKAFVNFSSESEASAAAYVLNGILYDDTRLTVKIKRSVTANKENLSNKQPPSRKDLIPSDQTVVISKVKANLSNTELRQGLFEALPFTYDKTIVSASGDSKGKLFVNFDSSEAAEKACKFLNNCNFLGSRRKAEIKALRTPVHNLVETILSTISVSSPLLSDVACQAVITMNLCDFLTIGGKSVETEYRAAGVLLYRFRPERQMIEVLLGTDRVTSKLSLLVRCVLSYL